MAEEFADFVLWGDEREAVEDDLDIPADLRNRMKAWVRECTDRQVRSSRPWADAERVEHDRRGHSMCQELQEALGNDYFVTYHFLTGQVRREVRSAAT